MTLIQQEAIGDNSLETTSELGSTMATAAYKKNKAGTSIVGDLLIKLAPRIGAVVVMEPEWGIAGQITFSNGRRRYFRFSSIDLNPLASSDIAKDKDFSTFFMKNMGYSTIEGQTFFTDKWADDIGSDRKRESAWQYANEIGFPVFVKPNSGSQGRAVSVVTNRDEFERAIDAVFKIDRVALIQRPMSGKDYRIVVLDDRVISAYQRIPLNVRGNGIDTILQLLHAKQLIFETNGRDTKIKFDDPRITETLSHIGLTLDDVIEPNRIVYLLSNANLSSGGDSVDVTSDVHPTVAKLAIELTRDMGLRMCGVDILLDAPINTPLEIYHIIEVNAAPGLDHYANIGAAQMETVEALYLELLQSMEKIVTF